MTSLVVAAPVVRRSALEAIHAELGARWAAEHTRWPKSYGAANAATESAAVAAGVGLAEIGPLDELLLRGPGAHTTAMSLGVGDHQTTFGRAIPIDLLGVEGKAWLLGPDEVLLVSTVGEVSTATLEAELASAEVSAIAMTGARTTLRLAGPSAPEILAELCSADTTTPVMGPGRVVQAPLAGVRAFICREDSGIHPGYTIMVARDEAAYVWEAFCRVGAAHALTPVGPAAVATTAVAHEEPG